MNSYSERYLMQAMGDLYRESNHKDGIPWNKAPIPRRWHRCKVQSDEWFGFRLYQKCACGAVRIDGGLWTMKNSRQKS